MPKLPTVLMTDCIRSIQVGQSHGGAYLVDLESGATRKVLDWNDPTINWEGRGQGRGLRGIAFHRGEIVIAASDEIFVFDQDFRIKRSYRNAYLGQCHEICIDGDRLYAASTGFDSVLTLDLAAGEFIGALMFRVAPAGEASGRPGAGAVRPRVIAYDPRVQPGPRAGDSVHLNMAWAQDGAVYFSGVRLRNVFKFDPREGTVSRHADVPTWTHNARPFLDGVLANSTGEDCICHFDLRGGVRKKFPVPRYAESALTNVPATKDVARQAFGRGLVATNDGLIIGSSSPSTITVYDWETCRVIKSINLTMDVRNAPHGLAVWPF